MNFVNTVSRNAFVYTEFHSSWNPFLCNEFTPSHMNLTCYVAIAKEVEQNGGLSVAHALQRECGLAIQGLIKKTPVLLSSWTGRTSGRRVWVYWKNEQEDNIEDGSVVEIGAEIMVWAVEASEGEPSWFKKSFSSLVCLSDQCGKVKKWQGPPIDQKVEVFAVDDPGSDRWKTTLPKLGNERMRNGSFLTGSRR